MTNDQFLQILKQEKVIAVIRANDVDLALQMAIAVAQGGINLIEITWNSHNPSEIIKQLTFKLPKCLIGTGTILTENDLTKAINSSVKFIFTPHLNLNLIKKAHHYQIPIIPGALTPTEIINAWQMGVTAVKIFPIASVGGVNYLKNLRSPLGDLPLIPTGGVAVENAPDLIKAGAIAVGLGGNLFPKTLIQEKNWEAITKIATKLKESLQ